MLLLLLSRFSYVRLCATPETAAHQGPCPWDSPGKNTGVGCHFLLQHMKVKVKLCPTPSNPMDCSLPGSSIHGTFPARVLEWVAIAFSVLLLNNIQLYVTFYLPIHLCFFHFLAIMNNAAVNIWVHIFM